LAVVKTIRLNPEDIHVGSPLPWPIYGENRCLLLRQGEIVTSERQLALLVERGLFRRLSLEEDAEPETAKRIRKNPFIAKQACADRLQLLLRDLADGVAANALQRTHEIATMIRALCELDADAILAAVHLSRDFDYATLHPIHTAILCDLLAVRLALPDEQRQSLIAAALTMNVGMLDLQNQLFEQAEPLTAEQSRAIQQHSHVGVELLSAAGIDDDVWLDIVLQHHERIDGGGYPNALTAESIRHKARILALADIYSALVTPRRHRKPILAKDALKTIFLGRGKEVDEELAGHFIRETGIFPPGAFVRLANGEIAVVARRAIVNQSRDSTAPIVYSVISPRGGRYESPICRDCNNEVFKIENICPAELDMHPVVEKIWMT